MQVLRLFLKLILYSLAAAFLVFVSGVLWFVYYSRDLPDINALAQFAPTATAEVADPCLPGPSTAIPYALFGKNLTNALHADAVSESGAGVISQMFHAFTDQKFIHRATLSTQISRTMFCTPSRMAKRPAR